MISVARHATPPVDYADTTRRGICAAAANRGRTTLRARSGRTAAASATATAAPPVSLCAAYDRCYSTAAAGPRHIPSEYPLTTGEVRGHHGRCARPIH